MKEKVPINWAGVRRDRSVRRRKCYEFMKEWDGDLGKRNVFLKGLAMSVHVFKKYEREWKLGGKTEALAQDLQRVRWQLRDKTRVVKSKSSEEQKVALVTEALYDICIRDRNWNACKAYLQMKGIFEEKGDGTVELNADEYYRIAEEAGRRTGRGGSVSGHGLLADQVCENSGQTKRDNSVGAVGTSN